MKRPIAEVLGDFFGIKGKVTKPSLNWEGVYFMAVGTFLLFQEFFLTADISGVVSNYHFLDLYARFTSSILAANRFLSVPLLAFLFSQLLGTHHLVCQEGCATFWVSITFCVW
jgi:hypothetical protein